MTDQTSTAAVDTETVDGAAGEPTLAERNLRFVVLKAMADELGAEMKRLRLDHTGELIDQYKATQCKSYSVRLPGGSLIADVTLRVPEDSLAYVDQDAFITWCEANHPDAVIVEHIDAEEEWTEVHPAVPARTEKSLDPKELGKVLEQFEVDGDNVIDRATGVVVDGVKNQPGATPNQFAVTFKKGGIDKIAAAWRDGKLNDVVAGTTLPAIGAPVIERHLVVAPAPVESRAVCTDRCRDRDHEYVDQCDPVNCGHHHPGGPAVMTGGAVPQPVSPARAALEEHADEIAAGYAEVDYSGSHGRLNGVGTLLCKCMDPDCPNDHYDSRTPDERRDAQLTYGGTGVAEPDAGEFDPGSW